MPFVVISKMVKFDKYMYNVILSLYGSKIAFGCHGYIKDIIIILDVYSFNLGERLVMCDVSWKSVDYDVPPPA